MLRIKTGLASAGYGLVVTAFIAFHPGPSAAEEGATHAGDASVHSAAPTAPVPVAAQGLQVYRDPQSGRIGPPPPGAKPLELSPAEQNMLSHSEEGLPAPRALPGGGEAIDLQGRFRNMAVATVGTGGQPTVSCAETPARAESELQAGQQAAAVPEN